MDVSKLPEIGAFEFHGVDVSNVVGTQIQTTCPFCGKADHFFISVDEKKKNVGQFDCKICGISGNRYTFLHLFYQMCAEDTATKDFKSIAKTRDWPDVSTFSDSALAYHRDSKRWLFPIYNDKGSVVDLLAWSGKKGDKWFHTKGCLGHFIGMENLSPDGPIFICEGPWDFLSLQRFFPEIDQRKNYSILSVLGCNSWPHGDIQRHFTNRDLVFLYDSGLEKAKHVVGKDTLTLDGQEWAAHRSIKEHHARSVQILQWPESYPHGYDLSDLFRDKGADDAWQLLGGYLKPYTVTVQNKKIGTCATLSDVIREFRASGVKIDRNFSDAMTVVLASLISIRFGGRPLWLFLVGPPGQGKSLILEATRDLDECEYVADLSRQALVSGHRAEGGEDPSLLARLGGRNLVIKDYSSLLGKGQIALDETINVLRECYDGRYVRPFGNGVRIYPDPSTGLDYWFFGLVAGTTREIHRHIKAGMGDQQRLLKIDMGSGKGASLEVTMQAITNKQSPWLEAQRAKQRQDAFTSFLSHIQVDPERPPKVTKAMIDRIACLSHASAICRAYLPRDGNGRGDLFYEPSIEGTARLAEQLTLEAQCLLCVLPQDPKRESEILRLLTKIAKHTSGGWRADVYSFLAKMPKAVPLLDVTKSVGLSKPTVEVCLKDLEVLHIVRRVRAQATQKGQPALLYELTKEGREVATKSRMFA